MIAQLDLFALAKPAPSKRAAAAPPPAPIPTRPAAAEAPSLTSIRGERCAEWEQLLADNAPLPPLRIIVSKLWTGVVVEDLSHPTLGRKMLHADGKIVPYPSWDSTHFHTVYMTADQARTVHVLHPLVPVGSPGTACRIFRLAAPDEETPLVPEMPEGM